MSNPNTRSAIARATDAVINNCMQVDTDKDQDDLLNGTESWEDLDVLVNEIGHLMLNMVDAVDSLTNQTEVLALLKDNYAEFERQRVAFFNDVKTYTDRVKEVQALHLNKSGRMTSIAEMVEYSAISTQYYTMTSELQILLAPSVTSMFLLLNEAVEAEKAQGDQQAAEVSTGA